MNQQNKCIRHKTIRLNSRDRSLTSQSISQCDFIIGNTNIHRANSISLNNFSMPNMVHNVDYTNNTFCYEVASNPGVPICFDIQSDFYNLDQFKTKLEAAFNASLPVGAGSVSVDLVSDNDPTNPQDDRLEITFTPGTETGIKIITDPDISTSATVSGFINVDYGYETTLTAPRRTGLFGLREIYMHIKDTNGQKTIVSDGGKNVSVHAVIPVNVSFGRRISYESPDRHYHEAILPRGRESINNLHITLRDYRGNVIDTQGFDWVATFDLDVIENC